MKRVVVLFVFVLFSLVSAAAQGPDPEKRSLEEALKAEGKFKILLKLLADPGLRDDGFVLQKPGEPVTLLAPNDEAFGKLPKGMLEGMRDASGKTSFGNLGLLIGWHVITGKVSLADMLVPVPGAPGKTYLKLRSINGSTIEILCDLHDGEHHPRINNGASQIGKGDIPFLNGVIHEIDNVLIMDSKNRTL